jgi:hypothetical protein
LLVVAKPVTIPRRYRWIVLLRRWNRTEARAVMRVGRMVAEQAGWMLAGGREGVGW